MQHKISVRFLKRICAIKSTHSLSHLTAFLNQFSVSTSRPLLIHDDPGLGAQVFFGNGLLKNFDPASPNRQGTSIAFVIPMRGPITIAAGSCGGSR